MALQITKLSPKLERRYAKATPKRTPRSVVYKVLIVCEGTQTEPLYFESFRNYNKGTRVYDIEVKGLGQNTISVVNKAIELKEQGEYDRVWAVFDRDSFPENNFNGAIKKAKDNGIDCAWSNEAFELWYLYHFVNRTTSMKRAEYKKAISAEVNKSPKFKQKKKYVYIKNSKDTYEILNLYGSMENAIKYAEAKSKEYTDQRYATHNPCTMVYKLVRQLIGKDEAFNRELAKKI